MEPTPVPEGQHDYVPLPPLLVNTSALEHYLAQLSRQLHEDLNKVKRSVRVNTEEVTQTSKALSRIQRMLAARSTEEMKARMARGSSQSPSELPSLFPADTHDSSLQQPPTGVEGSPLLSQHHGGPDSPMNSTRAADSRLEGSTGDGSGDQEDALSAMLAMAKKMSEENGDLKGSLDQSTNTIASFKQLQEDIKQHLEDINHRIRNQQRDFHELSLWLGTYNKEKETTLVVPRDPEAERRDPPTARFEDHDMYSPSDEEVELLISRSPLLLAFRRVLLRDLVERVSHAGTIQEKVTGAVFSDLKEDLANKVSCDRVVDIINEREAQESQSFSRNFARRLRDIENSYVKKSDFSACMKGKADSVFLPAKADNADVVDVEQRLTDKCTDLEERLAYIEAERSDLRQLLRSVLNARQNAGEVEEARGMNASQTSPVNAEPNNKSEPASTADPTTLGGFLAASPARDPPSARRGVPRRVFRVVGAGQSGFATAGSPLPPPSAEDPGEPIVAARSAPVPKGVVSLRASGGAPVGLTVNQAAYAQHVTNDPKRDVVESLPPLPYERKTHVRQ